MNFNLDNLFKKTLVRKITDPSIIDQTYRYWRIRTMYAMYIGYAAFYLTRKSFTFVIPQMIHDLDFTTEKVFSKIRNYDNSISSYTKYIANYFDRYFKRPSINKKARWLHSNPIFRNTSTTTTISYYTKIDIKHITTYDSFARHHCSQRWHLILALLMFESF